MSEHDVALAQGWFRKAESDMTTAQTMLASPGPYDTVCFHAQQAAEKYLKGLLVLDDEAIPHIHNLVVLSRLCAKKNASWNLDEEILSVLTEYAVGLRYELSFFPEKKLAVEALSLAEQVRATVLAKAERKLL